jgi:iron complex outermembrane receptor protein
MALAVHLSLAALVLSLPVAAPLHAAETASTARHAYHIGAGTLGDVLTQFAAVSRVRLAFDPALVAGLNSAGLQGSHTVREGFAAILAGSGYELAELGDGAYSLRKASPVPTAAKEAILPQLTVTVNGEKEHAQGPVRGYLAKRSATATRTDTPLIEIPQSITVVSADQIRDQASPNLQEALRYAAGVRNELYGIDNRGDWISLRGSEETTTLLDGMRLPLTGWYGVVRTEPYAYERIEVLRGPSSIIAGQNDPGGVVNLVSKRPQAEAGGELGVRIGNYNQQEVHADLTGPLNEDKSLLYRLVVVGKDSGTQVDHADEKRALVAPSLTWRPNAGDSLTVYGEYQYDRSKNTNAFLSLDGTLRPAPHGPIPMDLFIGEPSWDRYGGTRNRFGYAANLGLNDSWRLSHNLRHDRVDGVMKSMYAAWWDGFVNASGQASANGQYMNRLWYVYDDSSRVTTSDMTLQGDLRTGAVRHKLVFGLDATIHDSSQASAEGAATPLNVYAPVYGTDPEPFLDGATPKDNQIRRVGLLVQDQMKFTDQLSVRAGLRRDKVRNAGRGGAVNKDFATSVNVGLVYEILPGLAPYASYSESFNPVAGTDAAGKAFKPKQGKQVEAGVKWESPTLPLQATFAAYSLKEKNRLANDPSNPNSSIQIGASRVKGVEAEAKGDIASWSLVGSYTYTRVRATATAWGGNLDPEQQIEGVPEHAGSVWAVHDFRRLGLPGFKLGGGLRHVGRIGDGTGKVFVPSVTLYDAMASYDTGPWRFALNLNNLSDKKYIATCLARGDCWFGQRRKAVLSAAYRW